MPGARRQLAAIMFTDMVGYTALMGKNAAKALELLHQSREIQKPLVEKHGGKWLKEIGDGVMTQFNTALDAVNCALDIQRASKAGLDAEIRVGIHLGDITFENNDIYGNGVNVASRLESIASPGGIYISGAIYNAIKGSGDFHVKYLGKKRLKNVEDPISTYAVIDEDQYESRLRNSSKSKKYILPAAIAILIITIAIWQFKRINPTGKSKHPTLAVLPLISVNSDSADMYLVEGLTAELIRSLGKITAISVINPLSTMHYMASLQPAIDASKELKEATYFLQGSFDRVNNSIKMALVLRDNQNKKVWSDSFKEDMARLPEMMGTITSEISRAIDIELSADETYRIKEIGAVDPEIYELWLKGMTHLNRFTPQDFAQGLVYLQEAVDKNPADARAWAGLAEGYVYMGHSPAPIPGTWQKAKQAAIRAIQLDSTIAEAWASLAHTKTYFEWDYTGAEIAYRKADELNPSLAMNHYHYAWHLDLFDKLDEAIVEHKRAQELDPFQPVHTAWLAWLLAEAGRFDEAFKEARRSLEIVKDFPLGYFVTGELYRRQGKYDSAFIMLNKAAELQPNFKFMGLAKTYLETGEIDRGMEYVHELKSQPINSFSAYVLAKLYEEIDSVDQFFYYANYEPAHAFTPWLRVSTKNPLILQDPRFRQLMEKMNLPMPDPEE